jgi:hypothetical protein
MRTQEIKSSNPFPSYPVIRLNDDSVDILSVTVRTPDILRITEYIDDFCQQYDPENRSTLVVGIKGDYGSGKTHLVKYALSYLQKSLGNSVEATQIAVSATEEGAFGWYRHAIGPALRSINIAKLLELLVAEAAKNVASRAHITKQIIKILEQEPAKVWRLFSDDEVDTTEVHRAYREMLGGLCDSTTDSARRVLEKVPYGETKELALSWLCAVELDRSDLERLGVESNLESINEATGIIEGIAAISRHVQQPFIFVIDEFEHLARFDKPGERSNVTWTKRLIEGLATRKAIVFISGHLDAWIQLSDFEDRFSPGNPAISLLNISKGDVLEIVKARMPHEYEFGEKQARDVVDLTGGRMREVMSLLSAIYKESNGMQRALGTEEIASVSGELKQRPNLTNVIVSVHGTLERLGLAVSLEEESTSGFHLDLSGFSEGHLRVAVKVDHVATERTYIENVHLFNEQILKIRESYDGVIGVYLARGNIDDQYLVEQEKLKAHGIFFFDLDEREVLTRLERLLDEALSIPGHSPLKSFTGGSSRANAIEAQRMVESDAAVIRMEKLSEEVENPRQADLIRSQAAPDSRAYEVYKELSASPGILKRLRYISLRNVIMILSFLGAAIVVAVIRSGFLMKDYVQEPIQYILATGLFLLGIVYLWRNLVKIDHFFAFAARQLRELYVREVSEAGLVRAWNIIEGAIESLPLYEAREAAEKRLAVAFKELRYNSDEYQ